VNMAKQEADASRRGIQLDSSGQFPYSGSFAANAARVARADKRLTVYWDPNVIVGVNGDKGNYIPEIPNVPGRARLALGPMSAPAAEQYKVHTADLALPLAETTGADDVARAREFVAYSDASVAKAIGSQEIDPATGIGINDQGSLPSGAYPLATTLYAAMNLNASGLDVPARTDYAGLLDYAAGGGNVRTGARGGLPEGYVGLNTAQVERTRALADVLRLPPDEVVPPDDDPEGPGDDGDGTGGGGAGGDGQGPDTSTVVSSPDGSGGPGSGPGADRSADVTVPGGTAPGADGSGPGDAAASGETALTTAAFEASDAEATAGASAPARIALGATLATGLAGLAGAPFLLRRRDLAG
jgi:hypothetical protein